MIRRESVHLYGEIQHESHSLTISKTRLWGGDAGNKCRRLQIKVRGECLEAGQRESVFTSQIKWLNCIKMRQKDDWKWSSFLHVSAACTVMSEDVSFSSAAERVKLLSTKWSKRVWSKAAVNQVERSCCINVNHLVRAKASCPHTAGDVSLCWNKSLCPCGPFDHTFKRFHSVTIRPLRLHSDQFLNQRGLGCLSRAETLCLTHRRHRKTRKGDKMDPD